MTNHSTEFPADDYVLGTDDEEVRRLRLQHAVWRSRATSAWRRAGFTVGQHLLDVGCGPGCAIEDLTAVVGQRGRVTAIDRSSRFLDVLRDQSKRAQYGNVTPLQVDLNEEGLPLLEADGAWCRWVFAFITRPRQLLASVRDALTPGARIVIHEYFDYGTWRLTPRVESFEHFVTAVMESWRIGGGEPDIALDLVQWLAADGFNILSLRPYVDCIGPSDFAWHWPHTFAKAGLRRLVALNQMPAAAASDIRRTYRAAVSEPGVRMITPGVLEIIASRT